LVEKGVAFQFLLTELCHLPSKNTFLAAPEMRQSCWTWNAQVESFERSCAEEDEVAWLAKHNFVKRRRPSGMHDCCS
jgi:hypothetical protein